MSRRFFALLFVSVLVTAATVAQSTGLTVAVTYRGKGTVSEKNKVFVYLFDHPNPGAGSQPLGMQVLTRNGGSVAFSNVTHPVVYVGMVYDTSGAYDGQSGPPPVGAPYAVHSKAGAPVKVEPAKTRKVIATFTDTQKWGTPRPTPAPAKRGAR